MKKLSLLLSVVVFAPLFGEVRQGLSEMGHGARRVFEGAAEVITTPFEGAWKEEDTNVAYEREEERARQKRDKARQARKDKGEKGSWFSDESEDTVYKKEVKKAKEKRDKKKKQQKEREREEAREERYKN